mmetsp:Transcript_80179/g.232810  ORF Transcript_80179/g.232810 Transcript_80179/m.232810 type:complete len:241 (+) Transcript_80179:315-1037(+)
MMFKQVFSMVNNVFAINIMVSISAFLWKPKPKDSIQMLMPTSMFKLPKIMPAICIFVPPAAEPVREYGNTMCRMYGHTTSTCTKKTINDNFKPALAILFVRSGWSVPMCHQFTVGGSLNTSRKRILQPGAAKSCRASSISVRAAQTKSRWLWNRRTMYSLPVVNNLSGESASNHFLACSRSRFTPSNIASSLLAAVCSAPMQTELQEVSVPKRSNFFCKSTSMRSMNRSFMASTSPQTLL